MMPQDSLLVSLVKRVDRIPEPPEKQQRKRGHPKQYSDRLFLKALVIMIVRHLHKVHELLSVLAQPTAEMAQLRQLLTENGQYPTRRTWERRLKALPDRLPAQIGCLGRYLVALIQPWAHFGRAAAIDSTVLRANGGVWHQKDREKGEVPHSSIDTQAHWTKSGWHGWVYGWKLHVVSVAAAVWIPLAADLTPANVADQDPAPALIWELPEAVRFLLGDRHYHADPVEVACQLSNRILVTSHYGKYPHTDAGVEVRRVFHKLRSIAIENFNEHFKDIFDAHGQVPTKGLVNTRRFALGAILVYQLALWYRFEAGLDLNLGLKACLKAA
ncbi:MAG TPA: transposase [Aggregatilineaceae bacterium]|nr:transposase [Aggregatilineaceae bacterium]